MNLKGFLFSALMPMALASCNDMLEEVISSDSLRISVADAGSTDKTKAVYSEFTTTFEDGDKIGVYVVKDGQIVKANACFTFNGTAWTTTERVEYNDAYAYYAYYPYVSNPYTPDFSRQNANAIFDSFTKDANNKFHYDDQSTKENFQASDLMIAEGLKKGSNTVSFAMTHRKGLAVFNGDLAMEVTFSGINKPYTHDSKKYFHMKPETETSFTDDDTGTYSMSAPSGKYETHNINSTFVLEVRPAFESFNYTGGLSYWHIKSYKQNTAGTIKIPVSWNATFDADGDGNFTDLIPVWLQMTTSGPGSITNMSYTAKLSAQDVGTGVDTEPSTELADAAEVSNYDLSLHTVAGTSCSRTTANCYMVHAAGSYKLPLVYGNAIKNGTTNTEAYNPTGTNSETFLKPFVNHAGTGITNPWLKNNGAAPDGAKLIWQDVKGMISSVGISGDYLTFAVDKNNIAEGNAVIAATKGGTIVWSWHIWVTPEKYETLTTIAGTMRKYPYKFDVTQTNLGWVNSHSILWEGYAERSCDVKITQDGGKEQIFTILQEKNYTSVTQLTKGVNTFYQWGRKDPFCSAKNYNTTELKDLYDINGHKVSMLRKNFTSAGTSEDFGSIENGIKYPTYFYNNMNDDSPAKGSPFQINYVNIWNATSTKHPLGYNTIRCDKTIKTIYDPCPPGYCIPAEGLADIFNVNNINHLETAWDSTNKGGVTVGFSPNVFLPATGEWYYGGNLYKIWDNEGYTNNTVGHYWCSEASSSSSSGSGIGMNFSVHDSGNWFYQGNVKSYGYSIRPVLEKD